MYSTFFKKIFSLVCSFFLLCTNLYRNVWFWLGWFFHFSATFNFITNCRWYTHFDMFRSKQQQDKQHIEITVTSIKRQKKNTHTHTEWKSSKRIAFERVVYTKTSLYEFYSFEMKSLTCYSIGLYLVHFQYYC